MQEEQALQEETIDLKALILQYTQYWYYFLVSILFFGCIAFLYSRYTVPEYSVSTTLLIRDDNNTQMGAENLLEGLEMFSGKKNIENDFKQGLELMQSGKLETSIEIFTKVIKKNPNFAEAWNKRATVYYLLGDFDSSVLDINETLKLEPRHFGAMDGLGLIFINLQEYEKAIDVYDQMLKIFPHNLPTLRKREKLLQLLSQST